MNASAQKRRTTHAAEEGRAVASWKIVELYFFSIGVNFSRFKTQRIFACIWSCTPNVRLCDLCYLGDGRKRTIWFCAKKKTKKCSDYNTTRRNDEAIFEGPLRSPFKWRCAGWLCESLHYTDTLSRAWRIFHLMALAEWCTVVEWAVWRAYILD